MDADPWDSDTYNRWLDENSLVHYDSMDMDAGPRYAWVDVETTGLDPWVDVLLEIGLVVTDRYGKVCGPPLGLYINDKTEKRDIAYGEMSDFVRKMHNNSGLTLLNDPYSYTPSQHVYDAPNAEQIIVDYLATFSPLKTLYMAGSTVGFDRFAFLQRYMPAVHEFCHHRSVDNSTIKVLCEQHNPHLLRGLPEAKKLHRSLPDLVDSIHEHQFYLDNFFFIPGGKFD